MSGESDQSDLPKGLSPEKNIPYALTHFEKAAPPNRSPTQTQAETTEKDNATVIKEIEERRNQRLATRFSPPSVKENLGRVEELAKKLPPIIK